MLTLEDRKRIEKMWGENASPVEIAADLGICQATVYKELKRGQAFDEEGQVILDKNFRPDYNAERGEAMFKQNKRNCGRRPAAAIIK